MQTKNNSDDETIEADNKSHTETNGEKMKFCQSRD